MAVGNRQMTRSLLAWIAFAIVLALIGFGFVPLLSLGLGQGVSGLAGYAGHVVIFTLMQAFLSALISLAFGLLLARALAARRFPGRGLFIRLLIIPQALPAIVVVLALLGLFGESGWLGSLVPVYGLSGILLAHVFFNMPLAARLLLARLEAVPPESLRLAEQLRFGSLDSFRHVEWPVLAPALKSTGGLIFLLCAASFTVVLVLGGGPQATTLEVAIYQSLRMDFDPGFAALLSLAQLALCAAAILFAGRLATAPDVLPQTVAAQPWRRTGTGALLADAATLLLAALLLLPPLAILAAAGIMHLSLSATLASALFNSLLLGSCAALIALLLGWLLAEAAERQRNKWLRAAFTLATLASLIMPPAVLATGWFVSLAPHADVGSLAPFLIILLNALMALPFVRTILQPAIAESIERHDRLSASLGLTGIARLRWVELPVLRRPLGLAAIAALLLSLGDLAAITLFGTGEWLTLPALVYRQMGHYQMAEAEGTALVLALITLALTFLLMPRARPA